MSAFCCRFDVYTGETLFGKPNFHPGQVIFVSPTELVGIAVVTGPYYLGLIYCSNRPSKHVFYYWD